MPLVCRIRHFLASFLSRAFERALALLRQLFRLLKSDDQASVGAQKIRAGRRAVGNLAGLGIGQRLDEARTYRASISATHGKHVAEKRWPVVGSSGNGDRAWSQGGTAVIGGRNLRHWLPFADHAGHVLLDHDVKIRTTKAESRDAAAPGRERRSLPRPRLGIHFERDLVEGNGRAAHVAVDGRRQDLVVAGKHRFEQARGARGALEVADLRLDRTQRDFVLDGRAFRQHAGGALHFGQVAHLGRRPVAFEQGHGRRIEAGTTPRPLDGQALSNGIRGRDALTATVARPAHAANHGVNLVAGFFRVLQALAHEEGTALAHDEAIGAGGVGTRAIRRQGADLGEFDEGGGTHVAVHAARQRHFEVVIGQAVHGRLHARQGRRAGRVGGEIGTAQVVNRGHATGDDVGELARHGVFVGIRPPSVDLGGKVGHQGSACRLGQDLERGSRADGVQVFGKRQTMHGLIVALATHGVAHDDRGRFGVEWAVGMAGVAQGFACTQQCPLLPFVHGHRHARWDLKLGRVERNAADPAADFRIGLARRLGIGIVVIGGAPARGAHLGDRIPAFKHVAPETRRIG